MASPSSRVRARKMRSRKKHGRYVKSGQRRTRRSRIRARPNRYQKTSKRRLAMNSGEQGGAKGDQEPAPAQSEEISTSPPEATQCSSLACGGAWLKGPDDGWLWDTHLGLQEPPARWSLEVSHSIPHTFEKFKGPYTHLSCTADTIGVISSSGDFRALFERAAEIAAEGTGEKLSGSDILHPALLYHAHLYKIGSSYPYQEWRGGMIAVFHVFEDVQAHASSRAVCESFFRRPQGDDMFAAYIDDLCKDFGLNPIPPGYDYRIDVAPVVRKLDHARHLLIYSSTCNTFLSLNPESQHYLRALRELKVKLVEESDKLRAEMIQEYRELVESKVAPVLRRGGTLKDSAQDLLQEIEDDLATTTASWSDTEFPYWGLLLGAPVAELNHANWWATIVELFPQENNVGAIGELMGVSKDFRELRIRYERELRKRVEGEWWRFLEIVIQGVGSTLKDADSITPFRAVAGVEPEDYLVHLGDINYLKDWEPPDGLGLAKDGMYFCQAGAPTDALATEDAHE